MCGEVFAETGLFITVTVTEHESGAVTSGYLCSTGCLIDYTAKVAALEMVEGL
jgi:hypothetical protein